jgi:hypothetical protein
LGATVGKAVFKPQTAVEITQCPIKSLSAIKDAGIDIDAGDTFVGCIKYIVKQTRR